jgi:hypothetical protein
LRTSAEALAEWSRQLGAGFQRRVVWVRIRCGACNDTGTSHEKFPVVAITWAAVRRSYKSWLILMIGHVASAKYPHKEMQSGMG